MNTAESIFGHDFHGNVGVRYVKTIQTVSGPYILGGIVQQGPWENLITGYDDKTDLTMVRDKLEELTGVPAVAPVHFHAFKDLERNVRQQVARIKNHPYVRDIPVRGFIYDVKSGKLNEVTDQPRASQQSA